VARHKVIGATGRARALRCLPTMAVLLTSLGTAGCSPRSQVHPTLRAATPSATPATPNANPTATPPQALLSGCPPSAPEGALPLIARLPGDPDDVSVAPDGSVWVSDSDENAVLHISSTGHVLDRIDDRNAPEGSVVLPDGRVVIAEQADNRIVVVTPGGSALAKVLDVLPAATRDLGVDGIGYDTVDRQLLVPDSPVGELLSISPEDGSETLLASGMGRIVDATVGPGGAIYVVAETSHGLQRVPAGGGAAVQVGDLTDLDDVVALDGVLYVTDLGGTVWAVDPVTGADRELVSQAAAPQGLATVAGRLILVDETAHSVSWLTPCA
jgi:sugar lactone lactonase YvrE